MPYTMRKANGYRVSGPSGVHAKNTTKAKAAAQIRIMQAAEHGNRKLSDKARKRAQEKRG